MRIVQVVLHNGRILRLCKGVTPYGRLVPGHDAVVVGIASRLFGDNAEAYRMMSRLRHPRR
jgi:hypothetical protein